MSNENLGWKNHSLLFLPATAGTRNDFLGDTAPSILLSKLTVQWYKDTVRSDVERKEVNEWACLMRIVLQNLDWWFRCHFDLWCTSSLEFWFGRPLKHLSVYQEAANNRQWFWLKQSNYFPLFNAFYISH